MLTRAEKKSSEMEIRNVHASAPKMCALPERYVPVLIPVRQQQHMKLPIDKMRVLLFAVVILLAKASSLIKITRKPLAAIAGIVSVLISTSPLSLPYPSIADSGNRFSKETLLGTTLAPAPVGALSLSSSSSSSPLPSLQEQLERIQDSKAKLQKSILEAKEMESIGRQLKYEDGKLIAKGSIILSTENLNNVNKKDFPLGFDSPSAYSDEFNKGTPTLFILGVGREGPPLAAKRYQIQDITFPFVFELTTDDLLFPYTPEAWKSSSNSLDTIAVTAIITPTAALAEPNPITLLMFGFSEPVTIAGKLTRSAAQLSANIQNKVNTKLYTDEEKGLLMNVDKELEKRVSLLNK